MIEKACLKRTLRTGQFSIEVSIDGLKTVVSNRYAYILVMCRY